jgi:MerR family transcriptional regulator, light-induced transcriptional regulator
MASLARVEDKIGTRRASSPAQRQRSDSRGLADFRALATADPELSLSRLIESEIIPRLMVAHAGEMPATFSQDIVAGEVAALAPLALQVEADALLAHVEAIMMRGVTLDTLMVDLLAPTARLLGDLWESDRLDFVDVTMARWWWTRCSGVEDGRPTACARRRPPSWWVGSGGTGSTWSG